MAISACGRGDANRIGFAVQLCLLRYPGQGLMLKDAVEEVPAGFLHWVGSQVGIDPSCWPGYFLREATRREHLLELRSYLGLRPFAPADLRQSIMFLTELAMRTDKGSRDFCRKFHEQRVQRRGVINSWRWLSVRW